MNSLTNIRERLLLPLLLILALLSACLPPGEQQISEDSGELIISLTDAPGDFVHYAVDVQSITLTHANGSVVETVPQTTRVDFAQYVNVSEFFTSVQIPRGAYTSASMVLDFSNADIQVEDDSGNAVTLTQVVDTTGNPISQLQVNVQLEQGQLLIARDLPTLLALDFDLHASNEVIWDSNNGSHIVVRPVLVADINPQATKIHRLRGPLLDVDVEQQQFELAIHPFQHRQRDGNQHRFGQTRVSVDDNTIYDINGISYQGSAGLFAMQQLTSLTAVIVKGDLLRQPRAFVAHEVYAGDSVPGGSLDVVTGNITARSGDTLQVRGATLVRAGGYVVFNDQVSVTIDASTQVNKQGEITPGDISDLSVGQQVQLFGVLLDDNTLDATQGRAIMHYTHLAASIVSRDAPAQRLVANVQAIDRRQTTLFDFSGTGRDATQDADINNYEVATGDLPLQTIAINTPVRIIGHVNSFGQAPADFIARTIADVSQAKAIVSIAWVQGASPTATVAENQLQLSLLDTTPLHHAVRLGVRTDLTMFGENIKLQLEEDGQFLLIVADRPQLFLQASDFLQAITQQLEAGKSPQRLIATGHFDDATQTLHSHQLSIQL